VIVGPDKSWSCGNGYSKLAFTSNGVPTIGVGECNGILCVRSIFSMLAGGGLVRDRLNCRYIRIRWKSSKYSLETHPSIGKHRLRFDVVLRLRTLRRRCDSGKPTVWSPIRMTISHLLARIRRDNMIQSHQRERDGIRGGGRQKLHNF
jgi:hypothetical protein